MQQIVIRLPSQQKNLLQYLSQKQQLTVSDLVRTAITNYLEKINKKEKNLLIELAKLNKKSKIKAPKNLSSNYKKHLY